MPHIKGTPRTAGSGRKKGTPNKNSVAIKQLIEDEEDDVPGPLVLWRVGRKAANMGLDARDSGLVSAGVGAMGKALGFAYQTLKAVELSGEVKSDLTLIISEKAPDEPGSLAPPA